MWVNATRSIRAALFLGFWGGVVGAVPVLAGEVESASETSVFLSNNALTQDEVEEGWKLLFNGKDLSGWHLRESAAQPAGWTVADASIAYGGKGSTSILSEESFGDFELTMDWKVGAGADAGVFLRVWNEKEDPSHLGPEVQLTDNLLNSQAMEPKRSAGACTHLYAPSQDATLPVGLFNKLRVVVIGPKVEHWINGTKVVSYQLGGEDWENRLARSPLKAYTGLGSGPQGFIGLQQVSTSIRFRNIKIRPLGGAMGILPRKSIAGKSTVPRFLAGVMITEFWGARDARGRAAAALKTGK